MSAVADEIARLEDEARGRLDPDSYHYYAAGAGDEVTTRESAAAWSRFRFRPQVLRAVGTVDLSASLPDVTLPSPVAVAPMAFQSLLHESGEVGTVTGAAGRLTVISTRATRALADIGAAATGPWWFQVYETIDRSLSTRLAEHAASVGASALVLTGDTPYVGRKKRGGRLSALSDEAWATNVGPFLEPDSDVDVDFEQDPDVTEDAIGRLTSATGLPVFVKGVLRGDDARRCLDAGAAGLIVSNHGGRQLDRSVPAALALADVVTEAGDAPVLVDGGIRSGYDVLTALALGARAVLVGRPVAWALASGGASSVASLLDAFDDELAHVLALAGCTSAVSVPRDLVVRTP